MLLAVGCGGDDESESWSGTCDIASASVIGNDLNLVVQLNDMMVIEGGTLANGTGEWTVSDGEAVVDEAGTSSTSVGQIFRCESAGGCTNQGDPYGQGETLFQVKAGGSQPQDIIMKGTVSPDSADTYSGICQTRRSGVVISGSFTLTRK